jgi:hypothetical protein
MKSDHWNEHFDPRILAVPALAFFGGAVAGRILGLRGLLRGAMAALALGTAGRRLLDDPSKTARLARSPKPIRRAVHRRTSLKKSLARRRG